MQAFNCHAQFPWSQRISAANNWPEGEPNIGLALDTNDNCYVTGFFDNTNNFGGITLSNRSVGGSDIFVAKYSSAGTLQWVQQAGATTINYGRAVGVDNNTNVYIAGGYSGQAKFGGTTLAASSGGNFFLAKYNNAGVVQWVRQSTGGSSDVSGIGLAVDGAGNSYALVAVDYLGGSAASITFGSKTVNIPADNGSPVMILVKYDNTGAAQWAQLMGGSDEIFATRVVVDASGNVYVRGGFYSTLTIGATTLTISAGADENMYVAKFNGSGALTWVQQIDGGSTAEGGVAVDPVGNVFVSGAFTGTLDLGGGILLTNVAGPTAPFGDSFLIKYNSVGSLQWAEVAGGTNGAFYWDLALDAQTNIYAAGIWGINAAVVKYNLSGTLQWNSSASGPPAAPVSSGVTKCAVDSSGHCYIDGFYQGTATFGSNTLQPLEAFNFFVSEVTGPVPLSLSAPKTSGSNFAFQVSGPSGSNYVLQVSRNLLTWNSLVTSTIPVSGSVTLTNPISGSNQGFYRTYLK